MELWSRAGTGQRRRRIIRGKNSWGRREREEDKGGEEGKTREDGSC